MPKTTVICVCLAVMKDKTSRSITKDGDRFVDAFTTVNEAPEDRSAASCALDLCRMKPRFGVAGVSRRSLAPNDYKPFLLLPRPRGALSALTEVESP